MADNDKRLLMDVLEAINEEIGLEADLNPTLSALDRASLKGWADGLEANFELWASDEAIEYAQHDWHEPRDSDLHHSQTVYAAAPGLTLFVLTERYAYVAEVTKRARSVERPRVTKAHLIRRDAISSLVATPTEFDPGQGVERHPLLIDVKYEGYPATIHIPSMSNRSAMMEVDPSLLWKLRDDLLAKHQSTSTETPPPSDPA